MLGDKTYTLAEAAVITGIPEKELKDAIRGGRLPATYQKGAYITRHADLVALLKERQKSTPQTAAPRGRRRVLVIDGEGNHANIIKFELERDPRIESRTAADGETGLKMARTFTPDLCAFEWRLPDLSGRKVVEGLREAAGETPVHFVPYTTDPETYLKGNPDVAGELENLETGPLLAKSSVVRPLITRIYEALDLGGKTRLHKNR